MRKLVEDLHISASEKDAEIIRLRMHLGDEKAKQTRRNASQASLLNHSKDPGSASKPTRLQDSQNGSPNHNKKKSSTQRIEKEISEIQRSHQHEMNHLQEKLKDQNRTAKERADAQE